MLHPISLPMVLALTAVVLAACDDIDTVPARHIVGSTPERGAVLMVENGCPACHTVPGVPGPRGKVGPPLEGFAERVYIAGTFPNSPENLVRWIMNSPAMLPATAMPDMQIGSTDARNIAAYLYTLH